jgi:hypothetical protein
MAEPSLEQPIIVRDDKKRGLNRSKKNYDADASKFKLIIPRAPDRVPPSCPRHTKY